MPVTVMPVVAMPVMTMPVMVMVPVTVIPVYLGGQLAGIVLYRRGDTGTAQRQRLCALGRCGNNKQSRNSGKAQHYPHVHMYPPWMQDVGNSARAIVPASRDTLQINVAAVQICETIERDVNAE
jgi:hypothetical protein